MNHKHKGDEPMIIHDLLVIAVRGMLQSPSVERVNLARLIVSLE
jgi:hypothetical protein